MAGNTNWEIYMGDYAASAFIVCEGRYSDTCTIVSKSNGTALIIKVVSRPPDI
jgi:hypothetical protein